MASALKQPPPEPPPELLFPELGELPPLPELPELPEDGLLFGPPSGVRPFAFSAQ